MKKYRVFFLDDHPLVRDWLTKLINDQPDLTTCGSAGDAPSAIEMLVQSPPDLVIADISLGQGSGLEFIKQVRKLLPDVRILVLSMHDELVYAERCLRAGARGYVMKRESASCVVTAIRRVLAGQLYMSESLSSAMAEKLLSGSSQTPLPMESRLSDRELEIFQLLAEGLQSRHIATSLHISMKTVQAHCANIKQKLGLSTATELLREALRWKEHNVRPST